MYTHAVYALCAKWRGSRETASRIIDLIAATEANRMRRIVDPFSLPARLLQNEHPNFSATVMNHPAFSTRARIAGLL